MIRNGDQKSLDELHMTKILSFVLTATLCASFVARAETGREKAAFLAHWL
jgi:hypothetical protein